jgi:VWFA-related protein
VVPRWLPCSVLAGLLAVGPTAQDQQPTFRTEANYVRVDVYPTAKGVPVADLRKDDFEIFENNQPQTIDAFEHVIVSGQVPQEARREPTSVAESRAMLENPRARVFVMFLDYYHVDVGGSNNMRKGLIEALDRAIGAEDLVGVMTPEMSALDVTFARKTTTIANILERHWTWGERDQLISKDPEDLRYRQCYPQFVPQPGCMDDKGTAEEMIERRREKLTLDALQDLVRYLRGAREERKAILVLSNGWRLFRPNQSLARPVNCVVPGAPPAVGIDPRTGRPTTRNTTSAASTSQGECDRDRMNLAQIDNEQQFREIVEEANRANASFYPIDPRGLAVFDEPIMKVGQVGPPPPTLPPSVDAARLRARNESLRILAADTDGIAIVSTNNLAGGLKRVAADLSSYYLLGYYSTTRLDGRFHAIRVRVKRPGVEVRARRGYLAPTAAEVTAAANRSAAAAGVPLDADALEALAVEASLAPLESLVRERPLRLHAVAGWRPDNMAAVWAVGEVSAAAEWKGGAEIDVRLTGRSGEALETRHVQLGAGMRAFSAMLAPAQPLVPGDYGVSVRARGRGPDAMPTTASLVLPLRSAPAGTDAILIRRGPTTGNREVPTADVRFRRTEQLRVEVPASGSEAPTARLLGRNGKPLPLPLTTAVRDDADGARWHTAHLALAPLAPGDYVIELTMRSGGAGGAGGERMLVAFRIIP